MKNKRKYMMLALVIAVFCVIACDMRLKVVHYTVKTDKLEKSVRIALVTDLHSCNYGENQNILIEGVEAQNPDLVLLGGDILDDKLPTKNAEITLEELANRYPCYYVSGNHEYWSNDIDRFKKIVEDFDIPVLEGETETLIVAEQKIRISGVDDPDVDFYKPDQIRFADQLNKTIKNSHEDGYQILLTHRPELINNYLEGDFNLVLAGHAHGGQWRIPFILNGLFAPNQGLFPKYAGGRYDFKNTVFIVSRGLARESTFVPRIFNRPELVIIDVITH